MSLVKRKCRTCGERLFLHNFSLSNGYHRLDCKECYNKAQRKKRRAKIGVARPESDNVEELRFIIRDLQKKNMELEQEANELNEEIISLQEQRNGA